MKFNPEIKKPCYVWTRVSSREQSEGYSLDAQKDSIEKYILENGMQIVKTFKVQESAKRTELRTQFKDMLKELRASKECRVLVIHKTDRLARDIRDSSAIKDWLEQDERNQLHVVHERLIITKKSPSYEKFIFNIQSTLANLYIDNLAEEVRKGMNGKAANGDYPGLAPYGFINKQSSDPKRMKRWIELDPEKAPLVKRMFDVYSTGIYTLGDVSRILFSEGMCTNERRWKGELIKGGKPLGKEVIRNILRNVFYTGYFFWNRQLYKGNHEVLVSQHLFDKVQEMLSKNRNGVKTKRCDLLFKGLMRCGECGRYVVGETQDIYVYYRCSLAPFAGQLPCLQKKYVRQDQLEEQIVKLFDVLTLPDDLLADLKQKLRANHNEEVKYHQQAVKRLLNEHETIEVKMKGLVEMRIAKEISSEHFLQQKAEYEKNLRVLQAQIDQHKNVDSTYLEEALKNFDMTKNPKRLWFRFENDEKRKMLNFLFSNLQVKNKILLIQWRKPFDLLAQYKQDMNVWSLANDFRTLDWVEVASHFRFAGNEVYNLWK